MPYCFIERPCDHLPPQLFWQDREVFLQARGYSLPPHYHDIAPGVPASPLCDDVLPTFSESNTPAARGKGVCAIQNSTNRLVYIKRTNTFGKEFAMALYLCTPPLLGDSRNPHPPLIESFTDEEDERITYMVLPYLRRVTEQEMRTVEDILELGSQLLRGIRFLHDIRILHRNIDSSLIMVDDAYAPDASSKPRPKYYLLNYSNAYPSVDFMHRYRHIRHQNLELSKDFPKDIQAVGYFLQTHFIDNYKRLSFLQPIVAGMITASYPGSYSSLREWAELRDRLSWFKRRALLNKKCGKLGIRL